MLRNAVRLLLCLPFLATGSWLTATESGYLFTDLGSADDLSSEANAISDSGVAVGSIMFSSQGTPRERAFFFSDGVRHFDFDGGSSPNMRSSALAVNTSGCAVGWTQATDLAPIYLAAWKAAASCPFNDTVFLYSLGGANTAGHGINDGNLIVGSSATATGESHAFSLAFGTTTLNDLGVLPGGSGSAAMAVSGDGVIVGFSSTSATVETATRWDAGTPTDLGAFPGSTSATRSYALAVNDLPSPQVVGWSHGPEAVGHPHAFVLQAASMTDLGTLTGGDWSEAFDVNDDGHVVGWARTADYFMHAVLWVDGVITDLNTVTGIPPGWVLAEARSINDAGQIVGRGVFGGADRAFLLTPVVVFNSTFDDGALAGWDVVVP